MKRIFFTVTNDLTYDQRMIRICNTLARSGYEITLTGRKLSTSAESKDLQFQQKRLNCFFVTGKAFYIEFNLRLFFFLLFKHMDCICAIDLDTIIPCYLVSILKGIPRVYDAHELFCEMKEIVSRPGIYSIWKGVEKFSVPRFPHGYTVNQPIAQEFEKMYAVQYEVIRNFSVLQPLTIPDKAEKYILYQGAVNEGRSFETLIPAMREVDSRLVICGDGNFLSQAKKLVAEYNLQDKVHFKGKLAPAELFEITRNAWIGITLFENNGLSNYLSLGNRFSDYIHAGIPQLCVDYPVYRELNNNYHVAVLTDNLSPFVIAKKINELMTNESLYKTLQKNCLVAREELCWDNEEQKLITFYNNISKQVG
ncbi:MAG: glycosyltransferase family 4 protein [Flavitalea sp.]